MKKENEIIQIIENVIEIEKQAISNLKDCDFQLLNQVISSINSSTGKLIVTGVGKSAMVARKMVATLNSTGSKATFLHTSDALHGDLGIISKEDIVLIISKSGSSLELRKFIPAAQKIGVYIIGMCSNPKSYLSAHCQETIIIPFDKEADPHDLAPTASIVAYLCICDAIAVSLQHLSNFTIDRFAQLHPGGSLGKKLLLTVGDIASRHEKPKVEPDESMTNLIYEMSSKRLGATVVINDNKVVGIITDGDVRRLIASQRDVYKTVASDFMSSNPVCLLADVLAIDALQIMNEKSISQLVIIEKDNSYLGLVHIHDLIKEGI